MNVVLAMPPAVPLPVKVIVTIAMASVVFLLARLRGARRPLLPGVRVSAVIASAIVIALDISVPDSYRRRLDNTGVLAALIGLCVGAIVAWRTLKRPRPDA